MNEMLYLLMKLAGLVATFGAVAGSVYYLMRLQAERASVRAGLADAFSSNASITVEGNKRRLPFMDRVIQPGIKGLADTIYKLGPDGMKEKTKKRLVLAGLSDRLDPDTFFAVSALTPVGAFVFVLMLRFMMGPSAPASLWLLVPASIYFLKMWLTKKVEARQQEIELALPDTLDLLTIAVEAGLGFDAALGRVVGSIQGPLSDELYRMLQELRIGVPRSEALRNLQERTDVQSLDQFITAINQADSFGISIGNVLRVQAATMRQKRSQIAEEKAAKAPVKLLFPMMACIFPALFTVLVGPAAISLIDNLAGKI